MVGGGVKRVLMAVGKTPKRQEKGEVISASQALMSQSVHLKHKVGRGEETFSVAKTLTLGGNTPGLSKGNFIPRVKI